MSDNDKPPILFPVNLPFLRGVEAWLWNHPKTTIFLMAISFGLISSPAWFSDVWSLFSNEAPIPKIVSLISSLPISFSWYWLPVGLGAIMLATISTLLWRERKRLETQVKSLEAEILKNSLPVPTPIGKAREVHAECEKRIARLMESEEAHSTRAEASGNALKEFKEKYSVAITMAEYQAPEIGKFVDVVRVCTHDPKLDDPMPTIKWAILLRNRSVYRISLDGDVGPLFFEGHKLTEHKELLENKIMGLYPERDGSIVFEQRLSPSEVNLLKSSPSGKFEFDKVMLYVKGSDAEHVTSHRVMIFSRFRATLGRCSDEKSQANEELSTEVDNLKSQLRDVRLQLAATKLEQGRP